MKKSAYIFLAAAALFAAASCESRITPDEELGDGILCFQPTLDGSSADAMPDSDPASRTKAAELVSADGTIAVPLTYEVVEGIAGQARNDEASPQTKAADLVSTDGSISLPLICEVIDGIAGQARNDEAPQTKGVLLNSDGDTWGDLGSYASSFYVASWKGSVSFVPANTTVSKATPLWQTATPYSWGATESATFYAYANLPASGATVSAASSAQTLTYSAVPAASSAQTDILMGYYSGTPKYDATLHKGGIAEIKFYHPMTAVRFKKGAFDATSVQFKSISIKGVYASGTATMSPTTMAKTNTYEKVSWNTSSSTTQTVTMTPASGTELTVDADNFIGDAFLLIPQTMTSTSSVKITVKAVLNGSTEEKELVAKLTSNEWKAGQTNVYTLAFDDPNN